MWSVKSKSTILRKELDSWHYNQILINDSRIVAYLGGNFLSVQIWGNLSLERCILWHISKDNAAKFVLAALYLWEVAKKCTEKSPAQFL